MNPIGTWPQPAVAVTGACTGWWLRSTAVASLAAGLVGTLATTAAVNAWARLFEPGHHGHTA
jgi:hypothetical protein